MTTHTHVSSLHGLVCLLPHFKHMNSMLSEKEISQIHEYIRTQENLHSLTSLYMQRHI